MPCKDYREKIQFDFCMTENDRAFAKMLFHVNIPIPYPEIIDFYNKHKNKGK